MFQFLSISFQRFFSISSNTQHLLWPYPAPKDHVLNKLGLPEDVSTQVTDFWPNRFKEDF